MYMHVISYCYYTQYSTVSVVPIHLLLYSLTFCMQMATIVAHLQCQQLWFADRYQRVNKHRNVRDRILYTCASCSVVLAVLLYSAKACSWMSMATVSVPAHWSTLSTCIRWLSYHLFACSKKRLCSSQLCKLVSLRKANFTAQEQYWRLSLSILITAAVNSANLPIRQQLPVIDLLSICTSI